MYRSVFACMLVLFCSFLRAQTPGFTFTNYNRANGLSDNFIQSIYEDSRGFIWLGTREGINRYDGNTFRTFYSHQNYGGKLPGNSNGQFNEYKPGHLFFQSDRSPVCMNTITLQFYTPPSLAGKACLKITPIGEKGYAMSEAGFCYLLDRNLNITDSLTPPLTIPGEAVTCDRITDELYLVGSTREYFLYHTASRKYQPLIGQQDMPEQQRMMIFHYTDPVTHHLYFSNFYEGLFEYDLNGKIIYNWARGYAPNEIQDGNIGGVYRRSDSILWVTTYGYGIYILNTRTRNFIHIYHDKNDPASLTENAVAALYMDSKNNTWVGTNGGLCKLSSTNSIIHVWRNGQNLIGSNSESMLLNILKGADNNMYLSSFSTSNVTKINTVTGQMSPLRADALPPMWCSNNMGKELIFTGGSTTVTYYDPVRDHYRMSGFLKEYFPVSEIVVLAFKHSNGDEWFSGNNGGGFVRIDAKDGSIHTYKKDGPRGKFKISYYACYAEDKNGDLWFGVNKSEIVLHWILKEDRFEEVDLFRFPGMKGLTMTGINDVRTDGRNNLWVALDGGGLFRYNINTGKVTHYGIGNGLPTNYIGSLQPDGKDRIWIGTPKGLSCFIPEEDRFITFTREDGLPEDFFNERCVYFDTVKNNLWIGSINTLMQFNPDSLLAVQKKSFPIYIDELFVNGKKFPGSPEESALLQPSANNLQFRFTGVDINNGKEIEYSYLLKGTDKDWNYNENSTTASYANLAPGEYTFMVRARHKGEKEWNEMAIPFRFTILTPWYKTSWFRLLLAAAIGLLIWFIIRTYYQRKLEKERSELERKRAIEKERTRIATDMHDDFGASLSRIKFLSEKLQIGHPENTGQQKDLEKISAYSDEMAEKMGEIVWALNKRYDTTGDLLSFCRSYASEYLADKPIQLHFEETSIPEMQLNGEIRRNIFLVMKEALHNIVKHAGASQIWISIRFDGDLEVTIRDNGTGFLPEQVRPFSNGLTNMKKRMEDIGGSFLIETGAGTCITIRVHPGIQQNTYKNS